MFIIFKVYLRHSLSPDNRDTEVEVKWHKIGQHTSSIHAATIIQQQHSSEWISEDAIQMVVTLCGSVTTWYASEARYR